MKFAAIPGIAALNLEVDIPGDNPERVENMLHSYGFNLDLSDLPETGHKIKLLGAYSTTCCEQKVVVLCFDCCGDPVRLVVMKDGTDLVQCCRAECRKGKIQRLVKKGEYMVAAIGMHPAEEILNLLKTRS